MGGKHESGMAAEDGGIGPEHVPSCVLSAFSDQVGDLEDIIQVQERAPEILAAVGSTWRRHELEHFQLATLHEHGWDVYALQYNDVIPVFPFQLKNRTLILEHCGCGEYRVVNLPGTWSWADLRGDAVHGS